MLGLGMEVDVSENRRCVRAQRHDVSFRGDESSLNILTQISSNYFGISNLVVPSYFQGDGILLFYSQTLTSQFKRLRSCCELGVGWL